MKHIISFISALLVSSAGWASPGAHGPNGEHLDAPTAQAGADATPRFETFTENFEMVGKLYDSELSVLIDRYKTNEPVLNASLTLSLNGTDYPATFHVDAGDYAFDQAPVMETLTQQGTHELIFTLTAGEESDLLLATLITGEQVAAGHHGSHGDKAGHGHSHGESGHHGHDDHHHDEWL
ncbi:MAG: hypothetical protein R3194_05170, partial [Limnobacter sp.]|nr:hypothetical protein [Limnobacter sp.]